MSVRLEFIMKCSVRSSSVLGRIVHRLSFVLCSTVSCTVNFNHFVPYLWTSHLDVFSFLKLSSVGWNGKILIMIYSAERKCLQCWVNYIGAVGWYLYNEIWIMATVCLLWTKLVLKVNSLYIVLLFVKLIMHNNYLIGININNFIWKTRWMFRGFR